MMWKQMMSLFAARPRRRMVEFVIAFGVGLLLIASRAGAQGGNAPTPSPEISRGLQFLNQQQFAEAVEVFAALTESEPKNGQAWFLLGYSHHAAGELDKALPAHLKAVELKFRVPVASYNVACVYALRGDAEQTLQWLEQARAAGFANPNQLRTDTDLDLLREDPRFIALLKSVSEAASPQSVALGDVATIGDAMPGLGGGVVVGGDGSLYVADFLTTIYKVNPDGSRKVFADNIKVPSGIAIDSKGRIYQSAFKGDEVLRFSPTGDTREVLASGIPGPVGIVIDGDDRVYVTSCKSSSIYTISPDGEAKKLVQSNLLKCPNGITRDDDGNLYVCNFNDGMVLRIDPGGEVTPLIAIPGNNNGHITWRHGYLWIAALNGNQLFRLSLDGELRLIAGTGAGSAQDGGALQATLYKPNAMAFDRAGTTLYWNEQRGYLPDAESKKASIVRKLTFRDGATTQATQPADESEAIVSNVTEHFEGGTGGIAIDADGNIFVADFVSKLYKVTPDGAMTVFAGGIMTPSGVAIDGGGNVYQSAFRADEILKYSPDGTGRELFASDIPGPVGIVVAPGGDLYVTSCKSSGVYRITPDGAATLFAQHAMLKCPNGIAIDDDGNLYTCDFNSGLVAKITPEGTVHRLVDIPGGNNGHITFHDGALYVAGKAACKLYRVSLEGALTQIAGSGKKGNLAGPAMQATFMRPNGMVFSPDGNTLYVNDFLGDPVNAYAKGPSVLRKVSWDASSASTR